MKKPVARARPSTNLLPPLGAAAPPRARVQPKTPGVSRAARLRAYVSGSLLTLGLLGVGYKAYGLQVSDGARWQAEADRQHLMTVQVSAPRGEILDAHGRALAVTADADSVWANPQALTDVAATAEKLSKLVGVDVITLESKLSADKRFAWVARQVSPEVADAVRAAKIPGVEITREPRRWYPGGNIGGPIIGRANIDGVGLDGIELALNDVLAGRRGTASALRDARGRAAMAEGMAVAEPGATVKLTLDRTIQAIADDAIGAAVTAHSALSGTVVVLDVATGQVLAMSSVPTYDPNEGPKPAKVGKGKAVADSASEGPRNRGMTDGYEIGSSMKLFTVAAALDAGVTRSNEMWDLEGGRFYVAGKRAPIRDVHHDAQLTTSGIIKRSSNVGAAKIGMRVGRERLDAALRRYGFGSKSGIELPGEQPGRIRPIAEWRDVGLATISFGYGLTVTPLQVAAAVATIGNGGMYTEPRIVSEVTAANGDVIYRPAPQRRQAMKPSTAKAIIPMMASVFDKGKKDGGTAGKIDVPGFVCGGKTGTAHKYDPELRGYSEHKYLSSMVGLAPIDNPRIAVVVLVDEPSGGDYYGGTVAGPVFATVVSETLRYLGVPGNAIVDATPSKAKAGAVAASDEDDDDRVAPGDDASADSLAVADGGTPDFYGLGLRRAVDRATAAGLEVSLQGSGRVVDQSPAPGAPSSGEPITLILSDDPRGGRALPAQRSAGVAP